MRLAEERGGQAERPRTEATGHVRCLRLLFSVSCNSSFWRLSSSSTRSTVPTVRCWRPPLVARIRTYATRVLAEVVLMVYKLLHVPTGRVPVRARRVRAPGGARDGRNRNRCVQCVLVLGRPAVVTTEGGRRVKRPSRAACTHSTLTPTGSMQQVPSRIHGAHATGRCLARLHLGKREAAQPYQRNMLVLGDGTQRQLEGGEQSEADTGQRPSSSAHSPQENVRCIGRRCGHSVLESGAPRRPPPAQRARVGAAAAAVQWPGAGCRGDASGDRPPPLDASARPRPAALRVDLAPGAASRGSRPPPRGEADGRPCSACCCCLRLAAPSADLPRRVGWSREPPSGRPGAPFRPAAAAARRAVAPRLWERVRRERFSGEGDSAPRTARSRAARSPLTLSSVIKRPHVAQRRPLAGVPPGHPPPAKKTGASMHMTTPPG